VDQTNKALTGKPSSGDERMLKLAQAGDHAAFEQLYRRNAGRVYALCLRMSGRVRTAEELTQEAFVRAWEKLGSFRGESLFSTWLSRLTINVVLGRKRKEARRPTHEDHERVLEQKPVDSDLHLDLEEAIAKLPQRARSVFVLHDIEQYSHNEIADLTGMAAGTSRAQLFRARRLLREALN